MTLAKFQNLKNRSFLLGVGAQKSGTTWLNVYLRKHPQIAMSPIKELHFFDQLYRPDLCEEHEKRLSSRLLQLAQTYGNNMEGFAEHAWPIIERMRMTNNPDVYLGYFDRLASGGADVVGEITPSYSLISAAGYRDIHECLSRYVGMIKVVFIMRNPVDRFWSQLGDNVRSGRISSVNGHVSTALRSPLHLERTRYDNTITQLEKVFEIDSIKYLFYETLFCEATLREVCDFLGVDFYEPPPEFYQQKINFSESEKRSTETTIQIRNEFMPVYDFVFRRFGDAVPDGWRDIYVK